MGPLVIIGAGLAAYRLAKAYRALDAERPLHLITQDDGAYYSKPALSTALRQQKTAHDLVLATAEQMQAQLDATIHAHTTVTAIDTSSKTLQLSTGEDMTYGQLVLGCGAAVIKPSIEGEGAEHVLHVNALADYRVLRERLDKPQRVLVVGAGLVGCELANDLLAAGHQVTVCALSDYPLDRLLVPEAGDILRQKLAAAGVDWHMAQSVLRIDRAGDAWSVSTDKGQVIEVDVVLSAVGLKSQVDLAAQAGITVNRGVVVDECGRTHVPDVYALGDCAEVCGQVMHYVAPLLVCAKALAQTLSGKATAIHYPAMPVVVKTTVCPMAVVWPRGHGGQWQIIEAGEDFVAHHVSDGALTGFILMNGAVGQRMVLQRDVVV